MNDIELKKVQQAELILQITYGLFFIIAGADKFFYVVTYWPKYVSPFLFQYALGVLWLSSLLEIILGVLLFTRYTLYSAWALLLWVGFVIVDLLSFGPEYLDIVVRDAIIGVGLFVYILLYRMLPHKS